MSTQDHSRHFGRLLTAMVTPFTPSGELDLEGAARLASYLVDEQKNDSLIINGTTGEAPTTSDSEKADLIRAVVDAIGDRAQVIAGVGTFDTGHSVHLAEQAAKSGAAGLLVVTPYYSKPPQHALLAHFRTVADSTELPVLLYDIPHRSGVQIQSETLMELARHDRIIGWKDAKGNLAATSQVLAGSDLVCYAGEDVMTLPMLSIGAWGVVGTSTHFVGAETKALIEAFGRGDNAEALRLHRKLLPIYLGIFRAQGVILTKAGLKLRGQDVGIPRSPLVGATDEEVLRLRQDLADVGLL